MDTLSDSNCQRDNEINETKSPKNRFAGTISQIKNTTWIGQDNFKSIIWPLQVTSLQIECKDHLKATDLFRVCTTSLKLVANIVQYHLHNTILVIWLWYWHCSGFSTVVLDYYRINRRGKNKNTRDVYVNILNILTLSYLTFEITSKLRGALSPNPIK